MDRKEVAQSLRNSYAETNKQLIIDELSKLKPFPKMRWAIPRSGDPHHSDKTTLRYGIYVPVREEDKSVNYILKKDGLHYIYGSCSFMSRERIVQLPSIKPCIDCLSDLESYVRYHNSIWQAIEESEK